MPFVDEHFEGCQEWVPTARLKVRWSGLEAFRHREAFWDRIDELGIGDAANYWATDDVFRALIDDNVAVGVPPGWCRRSDRL